MGGEEEEEEADQPCVPGVRSEGIKAASFFPFLLFHPHPLLHFSSKHCLSIRFFEMELV